jgi:DNA-3-methyladenine glycosylase I
MDDGKSRCAWAKDDLLIAYHDREWGVPTGDDRLLFELLVLEGAQAGLSWIQILRRRAAYREVFAGLDPARLATWNQAELGEAMGRPGIVRNLAKAASVVHNAQKFLAVQQEWGSFDRYLWAWVEGRPVVNRWTRADDVPKTTEVARRLAADLKRRGFLFVGPTICYSYLQATGRVMDHVTGCFRWAELATGRMPPADERANLENGR